MLSIRKHKRDEACDLQPSGAVEKCGRREHSIEHRDGCADRCHTTLSQRPAAAKKKEETRTLHVTQHTS
ncbi:hypothetical protein CFELI_00965 [Corynebacterium felinum]|uniref:Uncharacterized protein n=1 Tax=Corynebacterium felinum TaxID=131318 RepID=A0ABU2B789_9CORY|nr:hypothetical protein [Corynebacterium felinum]WJY93842.1 hypothetical protein CFELI_00965 [Corynebacterium felinum]